jgi:hypothetical protein
VSESKGATRAVDRMVDVIRADEPPEMDWDVIERSLLLRIRRGEGARPAPRPAAGLWRVLSFAAAAAILPIAVSASSGAGSSSSQAAQEIRAVDVERVAAAPGEAGTHGAHDLGALRAGDAVEASASAVTFSDAGNVRWTLSPESRLVVRSPIQNGDMDGKPGTVSRAPLAAAGVGHVVRLERGSLRVEVRPDLVQNGLIDVLAVEVANTRVAVHGTAFTVTLRNGEVIVDVEHGVVTVGPTGQRGATTGYQLPAGSRAAFSLDGGRQARWLPLEPARPASAVAAADLRGPSVAAPGPMAAPAVKDIAVGANEIPAANVDDDVPAMMDPPPAPLAKSAIGARSPTTSPGGEKLGDAATPAAIPAAVPAAKPVLTVGAVQAGLKRCFLQAHPPSEGAKLTATSTFTLVVDAEGAVKGAQFDPPLPSIQGCASFVFGNKFAPGTTKYAIPVQLSQ